MKMEILTKIHAKIRKNILIPKMHLETGTRNIEIGFSTRFMQHERNTREKNGFGPALLRML